MYIVHAQKFFLKINKNVKIHVIVMIYECDVNQK